MLSIEYLRLNRRQIIFLNKLSKYTIEVSRFYGFDLDEMLIVPNNVYSDSIFLYYLSDDKLKEMGYIDKDVEQYNVTLARQCKFLQDKYQFFMPFHATISILLNSIDEDSETINVKFMNEIEHNMTKTLQQFLILINDSLLSIRSGLYNETS